MKLPEEPTKTSKCIIRDSLTAEKVAIVFYQLSFLVPLRFLEVFLLFTKAVEPDDEALRLVNIRGLTFFLARTALVSSESTLLLGSQITSSLKGHTAVSY